MGRQDSLLIGGRFQQGQGTTGHLRGDLSPPPPSYKPPFVYTLYLVSELFYLNRVRFRINIEHMESGDIEKLIIYEKNIIIAILPLNTAKYWFDL